MKKQKNSQYYEGILQLRNPDEQIVAFIRKELMEHEHKGVFLSKEKKVRNGRDLYLSSNKFTILLGNKLRRKFGGIMKANEKLFSRDRQTGRDLYRVTVLYRPLGFIVGNYIGVKNKVVKITGTGRKITGTNIETGKKEFIDYKKEEIEPLTAYKTTVSKAYPETEVLHPETYQSVGIMNRKKLQPGEKVKVVLYKGVWVVG